MLNPIVMRIEQVLVTMMTAAIPNTPELDPLFNLLRGQTIHVTARARSNASGKSGVATKTWMLLGQCVAPSQRSNPAIQLQRI